MTTPEQPISPRGVPQIRPDWLVSVAWRLADLGLDHLRAGAESGVHVLEDEVDGEAWRFESQRLSDVGSTSVEHESDLFIPTDGSTATLRAGFQFTPWWDAERGRCVQARVEIGPRGAVTFDPENWFVLLPLPGEESRPSLPGLVEGTWITGGEPVRHASEPASPAELHGTWLGARDLAVLKADASVPELLLPASSLVKRKGLLGRGKLVPADLPGWLVRATAVGAIEPNWTGSEPLTELIEDGGFVVDSVDTADGQITFRGEAGVLTLTGPGLRAVVERAVTG